jgi:NAD(P)-dependent dehydrogenase (short-subunit alcohol dehydrogenase family)
MYTYLAYGVSKHGANMYTQKIRNFLASRPEYENIRIFMMHPGRMNTVMGAENKQIEPDESANGIFDVIEKRVDPKMEIPFINYRGEPMPY